MSETLKIQMRGWREGICEIPQAYIAMHWVAALEDCDRFLTKMKLIQVRVTLVRDGWMDGMRVMEVAAIASFEPGQKLRVFRWSDANGGSWFEKAAGQSLVEVAPNAPGRF